MCRELLNRHYYTIVSCKDRYYEDGILYYQSEVQSQPGVSS